MYMYVFEHECVVDIAGSFWNWRDQNEILWPRTQAKRPILKWNNYTIDLNFQRQKIFTKALCKENLNTQNILQQNICTAKCIVFTKA